MTFLQKNKGFLLAGAAAGAVNGLLGGGGGMVLIPLLRLLTPLSEDALFPSGVAVILPVCVTSLAVSLLNAPLPWKAALPWMLGSALGGLCSGIWGRRIPTRWLHKALGILVLWGGIRYLW